MELKEFIDLVISKKNETITDEVFLLIQNSHDLMHNYLKLVENEGLTKVNQQIGKAVKAKYNLTNEDFRRDETLSTLIQSHQIFK